MTTKLLSRMTLAALLVMAAGCASTDYRKGYATARSLDRTSENVRTQTAALQAAMQALNDLMLWPANDLRSQSSRFSQALDRFESASRRTMTAGASMRRNSEAFFQEWNKELEEMNFEAVRERSMNRRQEVNQQFDVVARRLAEAQEVVGPVTDYLRDIERALGTDLTREGLTALKPIVDNANQNALKVESALAKLSDALAEAADRMSPILVAPQPPATPKRK